MRRSAEERFWSKVNRDGDCWLWRGARTSTGYGHLNVDGRSVRAHRFSYALAHGCLPKHLVVCHRCDNRLCVRPSHLFIGTQSDNLADMRSKRRQRGGRPKATDAQVVEMRRMYWSGSKRICEIARLMGFSPGLVARAVKNGRASVPPPSAFGSAPKAISKGGSWNARARITVSTAVAIRDAYLSGAFTQDALVHRFGVSRATVQRIVSGKAWQVRSVDEAMREVAL